MDAAMKSVELSLMAQLRRYVALRREARQEEEIRWLKEQIVILEERIRALREA
jgi:hypothetical protein